MPLKALKFKPGVDRESTNYAAEGSYYKSEKVRFRNGFPEKLGGWVRYSTTQFLGYARALISWVVLTGDVLVGVGTHLKYYSEVGDVFTDITPIRASSIIDNNPFVATNGSSVITVTDTAHGARTNDFVTFSGTAGLGGVVTSIVLDAEYQVTVLTANSYTITVAVTANATDASGSPGGGAGVTAAYQIPVGLATYAAGVGFGAGSWGRLTWGSASAISTSDELRMWSHDNFGEDLITCVRNGGVYYWDSSVGGRMVALSALSGASWAPTQASVVLVSEVDRHVIVFGSNNLNGSDAFDPLLIRWSNAESAAVWQPAATNTAGDVRIQRGSYIVTALQTRQEILVWTNNSLYSMQFVGAPLVFSMTPIGDVYQVMSPNAVVAANGVVYWMSLNRFYKYDGRMQELPCSLERYVFDQMNIEQAFQVFAGVNYRYSEVWWFYCSGTSTTIDSYIIYNYADDVWVFGSMARTAWLDSGLRDFPMATDYNSRILLHEASVDDESGASAVAITSYIETADTDITDGEHFGFIRRMIPDISFNQSTTSTPSVNITIIPRDFPGNAQGSSVAKTVTATAVSPENLYTNQVYVRVRARQMALRIESSTLGTHWQLGVPRADIQPDGRR